MNAAGRLWALALAVQAACALAATAPADTGSGQPAVDHPGAVYFALPPHVPSFATVDLQRTPSTMEALRHTFRTLAAGMPSTTTAWVAPRIDGEAHPVQAGPADVGDAIGRIELLTIDVNRRGEPQGVVSRAVAVAIADRGCAFVVATVAHSVWDFERRASRIERGALTLHFADREYGAEDVERVLPDRAPDVSRGRTERDLALLRIRKAPPCAPVAVMPVFGPGDADRLGGAPAREASPAGAGPPATLLCPKREPGGGERLFRQPCAVLVITAPRSDDAATDAIAFNSCPGQQGDSGCPLVVEHPAIGTRMIGLQARALHWTDPKQPPRILELDEASRGPLLSGRVGEWLEALLADDAAGPSAPAPAPAAGDAAGGPRQPPVDAARGTTQRS